VCSGGSLNRVFSLNFGAGLSGGSLKQAVQLIFWAECSDVSGALGHTICVRVNALGEANIVYLGLR
jgi:hypothetical protein